MDKKTAVYICTGCGIGDALNIEQLKEEGTADFGIDVIKDHPFLCGQEGVDLIKQDIQGEGVNAVVIAACSHRVNYDVFNFGHDVILQRVNLREQVAWSQAPGEEDTQMLAEDNLRMGCSQAKDTQWVEPYKAEEEYSKDILVVGGRLAGMTAALGNGQGRVSGDPGGKRGHVGRLFGQDEAAGHPSLIRNWQRPGRPN